MNNRNNIADIEKFIAALIIMTLHRDVVGIRSDVYYFNDGWIFVELFLLITGYYTARHFEAEPTDNPFKSAFAYEMKKFLPILPYTAVAVATQWLVFGVVQVKNHSWSLKDFVFLFAGDFPFEMLLLNTADGGGTTVRHTFMVLDGSDCDFSDCVCYCGT